MNKIIGRGGLRAYLKNSQILYRLAISILSIKKKFEGMDLFNRSTSIEHHGAGRIKKDLIGTDNKIRIGKNSIVEHTLFRIRGNNNTIVIGNNCRIGPGCSIWIEGNGIKIIIGDGTTFTRLVHINAQERNSFITIGQNCMFSKNIVIRTSDSHPIYSLETGERINKAKPVIIGNDVWIAQDTKIMKGAVIGDGTVIGSNTMVSKEIPKHCLAVGMPAKVVKENIKWTREEIRFD